MARPKFRGEKPLETLIHLADQKHVAAIKYRKGVTASELPIRHIEPYGLTQGKEDAMVRAFQLKPQSGWRFFMIHKLEDVVDTGKPFKPRRKITLPQLKIAQRYEKNETWTSALKQYRNLVGDAMADGTVTTDELQEIEALKREKGLTIENIRFVHASMFHRCLGAIIEDNIVDEDERMQIRFLHRVLSKLGWSVAD